MHDRLPRLVAVTLLVCLVAASRLPAQAGLGHLEDATTAPKGMFRLRAITAWTRFDSRYGATGIEPLGASFTADSLGRSKFAPLEPIEDGIRSATQTPAFRLSLGRSRLDATGREEIVPLALEYGVTNRVAVSVLMPIVRRRVTMLFRLDSTGANVGPNLHRTSTTAAQTNVLVQTEFANAASQLQTRLTACQQNPSGAGCGAILAQAPALLTESQSFANTIATLYGSLTSTGLAFVPRSQSAEQAAIALRVTDFNLRYSALLGSDVIQAVPIGAAGPAGVSEFQNYLFDELRRDSLTSRELVGIGDVEIEFKFRVLDRPVTELRRLGVQLAIASGVRLPTGSRQSLSDVADLRLGQGQPVVDARAVLDAKLGRFGLTSIAQAAARQGEPIFPITGFVARDAFWAEIHVAPRWHVSEPFALHGAYSYRTTDQTGSDQLVGGGVSFMTLSSRRQGRAPPLEMRFTHLETVKGDPGRPRFFRDQLEVRIYYQLMSR